MWGCMGTFLEPWTRFIYNRVNDNWGDSEEDKERRKDRVTGMRERGVR